MLSFPCPVPREGESLFGTPTRPARPDYRIDHETGCWEWIKARSKRGYPTGRQHRLYYQAANGPIAKGVHVHHKCHNPGCINPDHLKAQEPREHYAQHRLTDKGLTLDDVREIRRLLHERVHPLEIAKRYGITRTAVYRYYRAESWALELGESTIVEYGPRTCEQCGGPIAPTKRRHARFCTKACQAYFNDLKYVRVRRERRRAEREAAAA